MKHLLAVFAACGLTACSVDAAAPDTPKGSFRLIPREEVTPGMRALYKRNRTHDGEGFHWVAMGEDYVHLIASAESWLSARTPRIRQLGPFQARTRIDEDPHRTTTIFADRTGARLMVTANNFAADGTRLTVPEEYVNVRIGGRPGVLSLAYSTQSSAALWKLGFFSEAVMCEVYVEDTLSASRRPGRAAASIIALAGSAVPLCDSQR